MIKKTFVAFLISVMPSLLLATDYIEIGVQDEQQVDLSQADSSEVWLRLDYPGYISGYCAIELESTIPIDKILEAFSFNKSPRRLSTYTASFGMPKSRYVDWVTMNSLSKATLKEVLEQHGGSLQAHAVPCKPPISKIM